MPLRCKASIEFRRYRVPSGGRPLSRKPYRSLSVLLVLITFSTRPSEAQKLLSDGIQDLANQISESAVREKKQRIAILPLRELYGQPTALGSYLSEELTTLLVQVGKFEVVERSQLDRILSELKLDRSGLIDAETAKKVGKLAGADALLTGTVTDLANSVGVNCRVIDGLSGKILGAAQTKIAKDADVTKILAISVPGANVPASPPETSAPVAPKSPQPEPSREFRHEENGLTIVLKECKASASVLDCDIIVTCLTEDRLVTIFGDGGSRLFDPEGNEVLSTKTSLGARTDNYYVQSTLIAGVPTKGRISFSGLPTGVTVASVIDIKVNAGDGNRFSAQFRNVPIQRP